MTIKKILVIGSGGREHAICNQLLNSSQKVKIFALPGNAGIGKIAENVLSIKPDNYIEIVNFCNSNNIDIVIIGPEKPLTDGLVDILNENKIKVFGPSKIASQLEGSKIFMKDLVSKNSIPTAHYKTFDDAKLAIEFLKQTEFPTVIKTDGLASGKGVIIPKNFEEGKEVINQIFSGKFGDAGKRIIIEDFMEGFEVSYFIICDGKNFIPLGFAHDHKKVGENETGLNTGGMGTYSPSPFVDKNLEEKIIRKIIRPTLKAMDRLNASFTGILFAGLMIVKNEPKLIEFNIRFGDPEAQVILPRIKTDFLSIIESAINQDLDKIKIEFDEQSKLVCVVMASKGYPENYKKGTTIKIDESLDKINNLSILHAGTILNNQELTSEGGRVLNIVAKANNFKTARSIAYEAINKIDWQDGFYRTDIAKKAENF